MIVIPLSSSKQTDRHLIGGKAAQLSACMRVGVPVPNGCTVTTDVWRLREQGKLSHDIFQEIEHACGSLSGDSFAVRSSAVVEDGNASAWAGQFSTYLSVSRRNLREKIESCMASGLLPGPQAYGAHFRVDMTTIPIAVLVQEMVPAESSGVIFTKDPVSNDDGVVVIEAVLGLGTKLVSGLETPDTYAFDKEKAVSTLLHAGNVTNPILSTSAVHHLANLALSLEKHFGTPQDIEWAYASGIYWVLQSRPITTF